MEAPIWQLRYPNSDLDELAAALEAGEQCRWSLAPIWAHDEMTRYTIGECLLGRIPPALDIKRIPGSIGRTLRHSLLSGHPETKTYVEAWDLDGASRPR